MVRSSRPEGRLEAPGHRGPRATMCGTLFLGYIEATGYQLALKWINSLLDDLEKSGLTVQKTKTQRH